MVDALDPDAFHTSCRIETLLLRVLGDYPTALKSRRELHLRTTLIDLSFTASNYIGRSVKHRTQLRPPEFT